MKIQYLFLPVALVLLSGCQKNIQTNDAVKQAVMKHLSQNTGLNLASMDIEVTAVTFKDNEADATVGFKPKGGAASGMSMRYTLEKKGAEWIVKKKADSGMGGGHGMGGAMPPAEAPAGAMPADHPPIGAMKGGEPKK